MSSLIVSSNSLILLEATSRWSVAWRRALRGKDVRIIETRSIVHCEEALSECPAAMVGVEVLESNVQQLLPAIDRWRQRFVAAAWLALAERELRPAELYLRDCGVCHVLYSRRDVPSAARLVIQHLVNHSMLESRTG